MDSVETENVPVTKDQEEDKSKSKDKGENWSPRARKTAKTIFLSISMFAVAGVSKNLEKEILNRFNYPLTLSFVHLVSSAVYSIPLLWFMGLRNFPVTLQQFLWVVLPMAIIKSLSVAAGHFSISEITVIYAQTIKACLPIFTVIFGLLFFKLQSSKRVFSSLILIFAGVVISSLTEAEFSSLGLILGLASTMGQSIQYLFNHRLAHESHIHGFELLALYARLSFFLLAPFWIFVHATEILKFVKTLPLEFFSAWEIPLLLAVDGVLNFVENIFAFWLFGVVTAPSHSVVGAAKRVVTISVSFVWFKSGVTVANLLGISTAILGVFLYSYFRFHDNKAANTNAKNTNNKGKGPTQTAENQNPSESHGGNTSLNSREEGV